MAREIYEKASERKHLAYTLTELLVVIAIFSALAAIIFPVFAAAKVNAMKGSSTSDLEQVYRICTLYSNDFDDRVPYAVQECEWNGHCASELDESTWELIQHDHIPSFTIAFQPYGFDRRLFRIQASSGPKVFNTYGSCYMYPLIVSSAPLKPLEGNDCPYFFEHGANFWNGGEYESNVEPGERWLTLNFDGHVRYSLYPDVFSKSDYCRGHFRL